MEISYAGSHSFLALQKRKEKKIVNFYSSTRSTLACAFQQANIPAIHSEAVFKNAYRHGNLLTPWQGPHSTSRDLEAFFLSAAPDGTPWDFSLPTFEPPLESTQDYALKFGVRLADDFLVEAVLMPEKTRLTLCVSTQAGCRQACSFCHTGRMGFTRNLSAAEIVGQVLQAQQWATQHSAWLTRAGLPTNQRITNLVFMGMGEPLDNLDALRATLEILLDPFGLQFAPRKVTVSTAGHLDGLRELVSWNLGIQIALSLHAVDPSLRRKIMPIEGRFPVQQVLQFFQDGLAEGNLKPPLVQYTLIAGVNDALDIAHQLVQLVQGIRPKVNLIPFNPFPGSAFQAPTRERLFAFQEILKQAGLSTSTRFSKGKDIRAACGQLHI